MQFLLSPRGRCLNGEGMDIRVRLWKNGGDIRFPFLSSRAFRAPRAPEIPISFDLSNGFHSGYPYSITIKSRSFSTLDKHAWKKYGTALPLTFLCLVTPIYRVVIDEVFRLSFLYSVCLFVCLFWIILGNGILFSTVLILKIWRGQKTSGRRKRHSLRESMIFSSLQLNWTCFTWSSSCGFLLLTS